MPALTAVDGYDATVRAIQELREIPALLVLDTYARAASAGGLDENATKDATKKGPSK